MRRTWASGARPPRSGCGPEPTTSPNRGSRPSRTAGEQGRVGAPEDLVHDRPGFVVEMGPSAALKHAALVLLRPARALHDSVNGNLRGGHEFHRHSSLLAAGRSRFPRGNDQGKAVDARFPRGNTPTASNKV